MNFTPINLQSLSSSNKVFVKLKLKWKILYLFSAIFFVFSIGIFIYSLFLTNKPQSPSTKAISPKYQTISFKYATFETIPFVIKYINDLPTNGQSYLDYLKSRNSQIEERVLISQINKQIFIYYILSRFFNVDEPFPNTYLTLLEKNQNFLDQYQENSIRYTGYYLKIRFRGYYGQREKEIKSTFGDQDLRQMAEEKINELIKNNPHPSSLFPNLNNDPLISQLNNNEKAIDYFENDLFDYPLFDDPDFYQYLEDAPLKKYSPIYVLKTKNPQISSIEEYAFLVFFIEKKEGKNIPVNYLINKKLNEISYR